ncbi:member Ras oncogene family RAB32 [Pelomyxa schiedti]|nr:member Ras oncogene family RAB32 [Pelomyxa schiedti]
MDDTGNDVDDSEQGPLTFKILVVGEGGAGKTCLIRRVVLNQFSSDYKQTVGVDFHLKDMVVTNHPVKIQMWDIAGQERYSNLQRVFFRGSDGAFIVFDMTNRLSFTRVLDWKTDIDSKVKWSDDTPIPVILLANKCDLEGAAVTEQEIASFAADNNFLAWYYTSAKKDEHPGITQALTHIASYIMEHTDVAPTQTTAPQIVLDAPPKNPTGCC